MRTGLPPVDSEREPLETGRPPISEPAWPPVFRNSSGLLAIL
jgi:hypothetical protein